MIGALGTICAATLPVALARTFAVGNYVVPSDSMSPTIHAGDRVIAVTTRPGMTCLEDILRS